MDKIYCANLIVLHFNTQYVLHYFDGVAFTIRQYTIIDTYCLL